jgi:hypothetical protein
MVNLIENNIKRLARLQHTKKQPEGIVVSGTSHPDGIPPITREDLEIGNMEEFMKGVRSDHKYHGNE